MSQNVFDEGIYDLRLAFGLDFQHVKADVTHVARDLVARRDAADRFAKENALNVSPDFEVSSLAHGRVV